MMLIRLHSRSLGFDGYAWVSVAGRSLGIHSAAWPPRAICRPGCKFAMLGILASLRACHFKSLSHRDLLTEPLLNSSEPILHVQAADAFELVGIGCHDRGADCIGVRGDQQVVSADWLSGPFQLRADSAVFGVGWNVKR
jgi:hypothetical protein